MCGCGRKFQAKKIGFSGLAAPSVLEGLSGVPTGTLCPQSHLGGSPTQAPLPGWGWPGVKPPPARQPISFTLPEMVQRCIAFVRLARLGHSDIDCTPLIADHMESPLGLWRTQAGPFLRTIGPQPFGGGGLLAVLSGFFLFALLNVVKISC